MSNVTKKLIITLLGSTVVLVLYRFLIVDNPMIRDTANLEDTSYHRFHQRIQTQLQPKIILLWDAFGISGDFMFGFESDSFTKRGCEVTDCILINDKSLLSKVSAVIIRDFKISEKHLFHKVDTQVYPYFQLESSINHRTPAPPAFEDFFNLTMTFRLDSDIVWTYFKFMDKAGVIIAPAMKPAWIPKTMRSNSMTSELKKTLSGKKHPVAVFVSHCHTNNDRLRLINELGDLIYVDVFGSCGKKVCSRIREATCFEMLRKSYYFYLSFENSNCKDYVTEKVFTALKYDTVPIVYGGADYSRFLPPNSYINARDYSTEELAKYLNDLIKNKTAYEAYFWWRNHYDIEILSYTHRYVNDGLHPFCELCKYLNQPEIQHHWYQNITEWWVGEENKKHCFKDVGK